MRKVTEQAVEAFKNRENFKSGNTEIITMGYTTEMWLFDNLIAYQGKGKKLNITNAGWKSDTTKERLNGLQGVSISQKSGVWFLNGVEWNGKPIEIK